MHTQCQVFYVNNYENPTIVVLCMGSEFDSIDATLSEEFVQKGL